MAAADTGVTWESLRAYVHVLAKARGWHHGVPIMSSTDPTRKVVLAKGCPLSDTHGHGVPVGFGSEMHVCSDSDVDEAAPGPVFVNEWHQRPKHVFSYREAGKYRVVTMDESQERFKVLVDSILCGAGAVDADAEITAMASLFRRINSNQREAYLLVGAFPETSKRSGISYILRKGKPTIAMRCTPVPEGGERRHFLAALCHHCLGYYSGTHVGVCPPSDEVLSTLLLIRGDEHALWKRSEQHGINDPLAGI